MAALSATLAASLLRGEGEGPAALFEAKDAVLRCRLSCKWEGGCGLSPSISPDLGLKLPILVALFAVLAAKSEFEEATLTRRDLSEEEEEELLDEGEVAIGELRVRSSSRDDGCCC